MNQLDPKSALIIWVAISIAICFFFGFVTSHIGSSFWWGFLFGPIGLLIAAVFVIGKSRNQVVVVKVVDPSPKVRIRRPGDPPAERSSRKETEMEEFNRRFDEGFARR